MRTGSGCEVGGYGYDGLAERERDCRWVEEVGRLSFAIC